MAFIREKESIGFDRGFYAGPVGYMGRNAADILVAIRSGLVTQSSDGVSSQEARYGANGGDSGPKTKVSIYAGAGLVPGSTVQGDEISDDDGDKIFENVDVAGTGYL
jgi:isochorismate synthase EntC